MPPDSINKNQSKIVTDLTQLKGGVTRSQMTTKAKTSIFDAIDTDKNGILDSTEMSIFQKADTNSDNVLSQGEIRQFIKDFNLKDQKIKKEDILNFLNEIGDNKNLKNVKSAVKDDKGNVKITYTDESTDVIQPDGKRINTQPCDNSINQPEIITVYDGDTKISETYINKKGTEDETQECTEYENGNAVSSIKKNSKGEIIAKYEYVNGKTSKSIVYNADGSTTETTYDTNASKEYAASTIITTDADGNTVETHYDTSSEQEQEVITKITTTNDGNNVETVEYENGKPKTVVVEKDNKVLNYEYDDTGSTRRLTSSVYGTDTSNPTIYTYGYDETDNKTYSLTGSNIEGKHISNVYHDGKTGKDYIVNYDGEGNTYIVVQDQETISQICHKFGMTKEEFRELNGNINLGDSMVGCEIKVKGELKANDDRLTKRLSGPDAMKAMNNRIWAQQRAEQLEARRKADLAECNRREVYQRRINNANINSFRDLALYLYGIEGVKTITPEQLQLRVNQLASLNPNIKTKADWNHANLIVNVAMSPEHTAGLKAEAQLREISKEYPVSPKYEAACSDGIQEQGYCGNIYAIARHLYFQENFTNDIPEEQLAYRAKEIRDMNPGFFDKNGNVIKEGNIKVKITKNNYLYQQQVKREQQQLAAQKEAMAKAPVQLFYSVADNHSGNTSIDKWEEYFFGKNAKFPINENNIVEIMGNYEKYIKTTTSDKSIFDTICSERGADDEKRIDLCNKIFSMLEKAAQKAGVKPKVITYARNKFRTSMNNEFNSAGTVNTIEMDEAANYLRNQIISAQTGGTVTGNESSQALTQLRDNYSEVSKTYDDARKEDGWTGKTGDVICGWFGCNTREDMKKMLGDEYDKVMSLQNCKTEAEFNAKFREIFGVNFKPENIAAYNRLQEQYQNAAAAKAAIAELDNAIKLGNSAQSMINVIKKTMQGVSEAQKDQAIENIIQSYGTPGLDMSKEVNRRNALRAYLETQKASLQEMYNANTNGGRDSLDDILTKMNQVRQGTFGTRDIGERVARFNENMQITEMVTTAGFEILATIALQFVPGVGQAAVARLGRWGIKAVKFARGAKSVNTGVKAASTAERTAATAKTAVAVAEGAEDASALAKAGQVAYSVISQGVATTAVESSNFILKDFDLTTEEGRQKYEEAKKEVGKKILMNMSFAGMGAGSSVLAPRLMSTFGIDSKLATKIADEVINAAGSYGISTIAGDEYGSTDAAIDILSGIIIAHIAHVKGATDTPAPKSDAPTIPKTDIPPASNGTLVTPKVDAPVTLPKAQQWQKVKIGDEEIEVPITKNADGSDNVDFTHGRKLNASGEYEYFDITTKDDIMLNSPSSQGAVRENPLETDVVKPDTEVKQAVMSSVKGSDEALRTADLTDESVQDRFLAMLDEEMPSSRRMPRRVRALQAMQKLVNSPEYSQLDDAHKQLAKLSTMRSNLIDPYVVLDDIQIPVEMRQRLSDIETCLKSPITAAALYKEGDFETLMLLAKQQGLDEATISQIKEAYSAAQANGCLLVRQSHVAPESIPLKPITKDGQTYNVRVIDCTDPDVFLNPIKYGLEAGTTADNIQLTVHMNDGINQHPGQTLGRMRQSDNLNLSATITDGQSALYGDQQVGLFLDYDMGSVSYASNYAAGTGFCKSNTDFAQSKLSLSESSRGTFIRERFIEHINKGGSGITQEDYAAFSRQFQNKSLSKQDLINISENGVIDINGKKVPIEQVEQALFDSSSDLMGISYEMRGIIVDNGFNEVNIFHPSIKGLYIRGNNADDTLEKIISPQLLEYAQKNDIPIIFQRKTA